MEELEIENVSVVICRPPLTTNDRLILRDEWPQKEVKIEPTKEDLLDYYGEIPNNSDYTQDKDFIDYLVDNKYPGWERY